jgi:hypothetical protein
MDKRPQEQNQDPLEILTHRNRVPVVLAHQQVDKQVQVAYQLTFKKLLIA